jgi:hypothetical protein
MKQIFGSVRIGILSASALAVAETFAPDDQARAAVVQSFEGGDRRTLRGWRGR